MPGASDSILEGPGAQMERDDERPEEAAQEESFAEMLEESFVKPVQFNPGQKVKAKIITISAEWIFLDMGGKSEGYLDRKELTDREGVLSVKEGDVIEVYYLPTKGSELRFTTQIAGGDAGRYYLEEAWQSGIPVEGLVEKEIKGGFEVKIAGGLRGFCPYSQMGLQGGGNPADLAGRHLSFRITQYGEKGRNIVLSNRAVLEEERQREREALKNSLREGEKVRGTIASIRDFGAFVKVGCVEGLIPISEIGWDRVENIHELLTIGQEVDVVALKLDWAKDRLSFSLKKALPDPWENLEKDFPVGSCHSGTVVRLTNFGAFVALASGVDGLLHISKLGAGKRIKHPHEVLATGQVVEVKVESIDKESKRLSLSLAGSGREEGEEDRGEEISRYVGGEHKSLGTMGDLLKAKLAAKKK